MRTPVSTQITARRTSSPAVARPSPELDPVISTFLREAVVKNGAKLIVVDPRFEHPLAHKADIFLPTRSRDYWLGGIAKAGLRAK